MTEKLSCLVSLMCMTHGTFLWSRSVDWRIMTQKSYAGLNAGFFEDKLFQIQISQFFTCMFYSGNCYLKWSWYVYVVRMTERGFRIDWIIAIEGGRCQKGGTGVSRQKWWRHTRIIGRYGGMIWVDVLWWWWVMSCHERVGVILGNERGCVFACREERYRSFIWF